MTRKPETTARAVLRAKQEGIGKPGRTTTVAGGTDTRRAWRKFDPDAFTDPDGRIQDFSYDILRRSYQGRELSALSYLRRKLRHPAGLLGHVVPHRDVIASILLLPPACPDLLADPDVLWSHLDADVIAPDQHLLAGPTIWFPELASRHCAIRQVQEFAQNCIVDQLGVAAQLIAHAPHRICLPGDFHIHLLCSARLIGPAGFGPFVPEILRPGCQKRMHAQWQAWRDE
jgi:hypothetical protein